MEDQGLRAPALEQDAGRDRHRPSQTRAVTFRKTQPGSAEATVLRRKVRIAAAPVSLETGYRLSLYQWPGLRRGRSRVWRASAQPVAPGQRSDRDNRNETPQPSHFAPPYHRPQRRAKQCQS
jgi:hypothetical protein